MDYISWSWSSDHTATPEWLLRNGVNKRCKYTSKKNSSSIQVATERDEGMLGVTVEVNIEDKPPGWTGWSSPFLYLSVRLQLDLTRKPIHQKQVDSYATRNGQEVIEAEDDRIKIEGYTHRILPIKYVEDTGWRLSSVKALREAIETWETIR